MAGGRRVVLGRRVVFTDNAPGTQQVPHDIARLARLPVPRGGNGAGGGMPDAAGGNAPSVPRSIVVFPLEVVPPPDAVMFNPYALATTNAAGQVVQLWSFLVPASSLLIVKSIDLYATNTTTATQLQFGIFANGVPYGQFGNIPLFAGTATVNARSFENQTWRFLENTLVTMQVTNTDGANYQVAAGAQGWYYSTTMAAKYGLGA